MKVRMAAASLMAKSVIAVPLLARAQQNHAKLFEFDPPGATTVNSPLCDPYCGTFVYANNDLGEVAGFHTDSEVVRHGFLRTPDGRFVSFDAPRAGLGAGMNQGIVANGINDLGVIVGYIEDSGYTYHSFIRYPNGRFISFDASGAGTGEYQGTAAWSINLEGATAGVFRQQLHGTRICALIRRKDRDLRSARFYFHRGLPGNLPQ